MENPHFLIKDHLNINSIWDKFEEIAEIIKEYDLLSVCETKLDSSFPIVQLKVTVLKLLDMNVIEFGSTLMVYVNEDIPFNLLNNFSVESLFEIIATELNQLIRK